MPHAAAGNVIEPQQYFHYHRNMETTHALRVFAALAQETRLAVFRRLVEWAPQGGHAGAIGESLSIAPATLSFHLKELAHAGLVHGTQEGRNVRYRANLDVVPSLVAFLTDNCCGGVVRCEPDTASPPRPACTG